jgi:hypothetical protein
LICRKFGGRFFSGLAADTFEDELRGKGFGSRTTHTRLPVSEAKKEEEQEKARNEVVGI